MNIKFGYFYVFVAYFCWNTAENGAPTDNGNKVVSASDWLDGPAKQKSVCSDPILLFFIFLF